MSEIVIKKRKKISVWDTVFVVCNTLFMILFVVITLYPVLNTLAISFNDGTDALRGGIYLWPRKFTLQNYTTVLQKNNLITGAYVTVARTVIGTALALAANSLLAFIVSRKRFLFKRQLSLFWVVTMYVNGGLIPTFLVVNELGLYNTRTILLVMGAFSVYNCIICRSFFAALPQDLEEAAEIDGCNPIRSFVQIVLPLSKALIGVMVLYFGVGHWNSYFNAMIYLVD